MNPGQRGRFITIEGSEGAGKSTNIEALMAHMRERGVDVVSTREPGGTPLAERIRELLLEAREESLDPMAELLLMFAARAQHLARVIRPALAEGRWVVCDRFTDASHAYQGAGRQMGAEPIDHLANLVHPDLSPDLTLYLDVPRADGLARTRHRGGLDRFEVETDPFFDRVRQCYLERAAAEPERIRVIDAAQPLGRVQEDVIRALDSFIDAWEVAGDGGG